MNKLAVILPAILFFVASCGAPSAKNEKRVITVTIPPFAWFVEGIAGDDFEISIMLPPGADHHIWEPLPAQITSLAKSEAFIINGKLGFEVAWMGRFREINPDMKVLDLSKNIELISGGDAGEKEGHTNHEGSVHSGPDPHYWMSPVSAYIIAKDIKDFLTELNPRSAGKYQANLDTLDRAIARVDSALKAAAATASPGIFMIYHPALGYLARDYGLQQVPFEDEGKSPSPSRMKELIDIVREKGINIIFIQAEYDIRNARSLSSETGAKLVVINPMNHDWPAAVMEVATTLTGGESKRTIEHTK
jgi:zinc transport system substrate-binding protein